MPLPNTASISITRAQPTPKIYSGWALDRSIVIDCACPGLLASSLYFAPARRQATFLVVAAIDWLGEQEIAQRLRKTAEVTDSTTPNDATLIGRAIVLLRRPRDLLRAVFGEVPDGLLGTMHRLGHDPIGEPARYRELLRLFSSRDPQDRRRVKVLGQIPGSLIGAHIEIVGQLDHALLHPAFVSKVRQANVDEMNAALAYVRARCSGATDEAVRASIGLLKADDRLNALFRHWAERFDRPPLNLDTSGDPGIRVLDSGPALIDAGRRFENCLASRISDVFLGAFLFAEVQPDQSGPPVLAELRATSQGWVLKGLHARKNRRIDAARASAVRRKLSACGVAVYAHAPDDPTAVHAAAGMLGSYDLGEAEINGWGEELDDPVDVLAEALNAAEAA